MSQRIRYRQIHLDFHTNEIIKNVGAGFDPEDFAATLKAGNVDSVTLFARCHHGWCYYPTKIGTPHPNLSRQDLLGDMIRACSASDIDTPIYITVQWDEKTAREHPEWRVMNADNMPHHWPGIEPSAMNQLTATWHTLCLENKEYVQYLIELGLELIDLYNAEGFFMDILGSHECVCPKCLARMERDRLDPTISIDRQKNDRNVIMDFFKIYTGTMRKRKPGIRLFYNSGHIFKGERDRYEYYSHLELESLPTGGWGYDHFPLSARYADTLNMDFIGMTGKFHTHWGEFGGFKRPAALEFECAHMISMGARCSIGDQLHPLGKLDSATYNNIAPAYTRVKKMEPYLLESNYQAQIGILSSEAALSGSMGKVERTTESDAGAARMLLELKHPFDVLDPDADFSKYTLLILPDNIAFDEKLKKKINTFISGDGKIIHSGSSGMDMEKKKFLFDTGLEYHGKRGEWNPDYILSGPELDSDIPSSPIVMYASPYIVSAGKNNSLGECRRPYFNRSYKHFCSHLHTPCDMEARKHGDAVIETEYGYYFSHEIFKLYYQYGQPLYKYLFRGAVDKLIPKPLIRTNLPSAGRVTLLKQENNNRYILNLLYAPTQLRGSKALNHLLKETMIEIIEDIPELRDIQITLCLREIPVRIYNAYTNIPLEWTREEDITTFTLPSLNIHEAVVVEYGEQYA